jgi:hypothetical protein
MFVGYSKQHSSLVPLCLNIQTGKITPQFHVVFDDKFETVISAPPRGESLRDEWMDILRFERDCFVDDDLDPDTDLPLEFTRWFKDGVLNDSAHDDKMAPPAHPQCRPQVIDYGDAIEVIDGITALDTRQRELRAIFPLFLTWSQREIRMRLLPYPIISSKPVTLLMQLQRELRLTLHLQ